MKAKLLIALVLLSAALFAQEAPPNVPQYTKDGELIRPENYREWIYLSSGLGMTYGAPIASRDEEDFDNVFVTPQAYKAFLATGTWPDKSLTTLPKISESPPRRGDSSDGRLRWSCPPPAGSCRRRGW